MKLHTALVHAGEPDPPIAGSVAMPVFQSATFIHTGAGEYSDVRYARLSNTPNHDVLHAKLAAVCGGEAALVTSSGMSAITATLLGLLSAGDHLLAHRTLYGGTFGFLTHHARRWGIDHSLVGGDDPAEWADACRPNTRILYLETLTNPLVQIADLRAAVAFARERGLITVVDNTFASPVNCRPLDLGVNVVVHSATKYLNGHSDICAGAVVGSAELVRQIKLALDHLGGSLDPHAAVLLHRGLKTLGLRVPAQNRNAETLASFFDSHPRVEAVHYPTLPGHPHHARSKELEGCGGVLSIAITGSVGEVDAMLGRLRLCKQAPSLGGVETLVTRPATTSHAGLSPEERRAAGIGDTLVRIAVGIEDPEDLVEDFRQALDG